MTQLMGYLNATALVIGYLVLSLWLIFFLWLGASIVKQLSIEWRVKDRKSKEWDNTHSSWLIDKMSNTLYNNQEELERDDKQSSQSGRKVRRGQLAQASHGLRSSWHSNDRISDR